MSTLTFTIENENDTERLGSALAEVLPPGTVVGLIGTLGAGKTRLVQAVASALEVPRATVTSPTFVLVNEYPAQKPIYHFDTYRLRDEDEFLELGPDEYFESEGLTFVEWADRFPRCLPPARITIQLDVTGNTSRQATVTATGARLSAVVVELEAKLSETR